MHRWALTVAGLTAVTWASMVSIATAADTIDPVGSDLWPELKEAYLGDAPVVYDKAIKLVMPLKVEDAANVPVIVRISEDLGQLTELTVIAENNPIQSAVRIFPRRQMYTAGMNIRLEQSTPVRAAALDANGVWHVSTLEIDVTGPGGCSVGSSQVVENELGEIAVRQFNRADGASRLKVKINHPMDTGFAMDSNDELVPAYYIETMTVEDEFGPVADMITSAALASDPSFFFDLPDRRQSVRVHASDTNGLTFEALDPAPSM